MLFTTNLMYNSEFLLLPATNPDFNFRNDHR